MIRHTDLGTTPFARLRTLAGLVKHREITRGGNQPGKIYGLLSCRAGKRMMAANRVFFRDEAEAIRQGFRPCAVCLPIAYSAWRQTHQ